MININTDYQYFCTTMTLCKHRVVCTIFVFEAVFVSLYIAAHKDPSLRHRAKDKLPKSHCSKEKLLAKICCICICIVIEFVYIYLYLCLCLSVSNRASHSQWSTRKTNQPTVFVSKKKKLSKRWCERICQRSTYFTLFSQIQNLSFAVFFFSFPNQLHWG